MTEDTLPENFHPPAGADAEYKFGWLFRSAASTREDIKQMRAQSAALQASVEGLPDRIMVQVNGALDRQTETLKPLLLEREVREATAKAADEALARRVAQATIRQTPIAFWGMVFVGLALIGAAFGAASKYVHIGPDTSVLTAVSAKP